MPLDGKEALDKVPGLFGVIRSFVRSMRKNSPGGKRITRAEWVAIGRELGVFGIDVGRDVLD